MPITFKCRHSPDIVMLETMGLELIRMMGHSGTVPGSLATEDIPAALASLETAVTSAPGRSLDSERKDAGDEESERPTITVAQRAGPLIEMLTRAAREGDYVIWDR